MTARDRRRRQILKQNLIYVIIAYCITQLAGFVGKVAGLSSITHGQILFILCTAVGATILYFPFINARKRFTDTYVNVVFFSQFVVWLILYAFWIYFLAELRSLALFFALLALIFLISNSNFLQSAVISISATIVQITISYCAIHLKGQPGQFKEELLYTASFLPSAIFISYLAGKYYRQRGNIRKAKRAAEKTRDALWGEMELAKKIQTSLLPRSPSIENYQISAFMKPAEVVGGDYYDVINIKGRDWITIGDVSGHGVPAGLFMMMVQTAIRTALNKHPEITPSKLLANINAVITQNLRLMSEDKYMTLMVLSVNEAGAFTFSGLHQDVLVYRSKTETIEVFDTKGMWLGVMDDVEELLEDDQIQLEIGDTLLVYTDGITEATTQSEHESNIKPRQTKMFGIDNLARILLERGGGSPDDLKNEILTRLEDYTCDDDITLVCLKRVE